MASQRFSLESTYRTYEAAQELFGSEYPRYRLSLRVVIASRCLVLGALAIVFITYFQTDLIIISVIGVLAVGYAFLESAAYKRRLDEVRLTMDVIYSSKLKAELELSAYVEREDKQLKNQSPEFQSAKEKLIEMATNEIQEFNRPREEEKESR